MISIIIVSYRCWDRLSLCLQSIISQDLKDLEVIVVDNNSADGKAENFITQFPDFRFMLLEDNEGFAKACNRGAKEASGDRKSVV